MNVFIWFLMLTGHTCQDNIEPIRLTKKVIHVIKLKMVILYIRLWHYSFMIRFYIYFLINVAN